MAETGTLASEFLRDFDELENEEDVDADGVKTESAGEVGRAEGRRGGNLGIGKKKSKEGLATSAEISALYERITPIKRMVGEWVDGFSSLGDEAQASPELYEHLIKANEGTVVLDEVIGKITQIVKEIYKKRLPELESIILDPLQYLQTVARIRNLKDVSGVKFGDYLNASTEMVLKLSVNSSVGASLNAQEMESAVALCELGISLNNDLQSINDFVGKHMNLLAPNLSVIVGPSVAAKLLGAAGGLNNIWKLTASSLTNLGIKRESVGGHAKSYTGILHDTDIVKDAPISMRKRVLKEIAGKCILATRVDAFQQKPNSEYGDELRQEIEKKIKKWQEKPPAKQVKPIPAPSDERRTRRGGVRQRKRKAKYEMTELVRASKRVPFAKQEETDLFTGKGFGMLSSTQMANKVRIIAKNNQNLGKAAQRRLLSHKKYQKERDRSINVRAREEPKFGGSTTVSFSTVQGMELENPNAESVRKGLAAPSSKYFHNK